MPEPAAEDLDALRAAFDAATPLTVGVEEEYFVLDPASGRPVWDAPRLVEALADARFKQELPACQLEHASAPCADLAEAAAAIDAARQHLAGAVPGAAFAAAGTHPTCGRVDRVPEDPRYSETLRAHPWSAQQQMVGALQVHVAVGSADVALAVHDAVRSYLPDLVALSANAPFWEGRDTGLASVRPLVATLLPRQGIPPAFGSWERYAALRSWMGAAGVADERRLWWEVRLRPAFGTLELRAMDSQLTARDAAAVTAVAAGLVAWLAQRARGGEPLPVHDTERIAENRWRAVHHGPAGALADLDSGDDQPFTERLGRLAEAIAPAVEALGGAGLLDDALRLAADGGAARQRAAAAGADIEGVGCWMGRVFARG